MSNNLELTITRHIPAAPKAVFEAWLDPAALAKFLKPMPGMADCSVELDAKEGGVFSFTMRAGDQDFPIKGEYKSIVKYSDLVFTWLSSSTVAESTVTLKFEETAEGECDLTLHHVGFADEEARNNHDGGWTSIVEQLAARLA